MPKYHLSARDLASLCAEVRPDDGFDPRNLRAAEKRPRKPHRPRHHGPLCRQTAHTLQLALADCADPAVQDLLVAAVEPAPDASRLRVTLQPSTHPPIAPPDVLLPRLHALTGHLRAQVALAINRRRAPELVFHLVPHGWRRP